MKYVFLALIATVLGGVIVYVNTRAELVDVQSEVAASPSPSPSPSFTPSPNPTQTEEPAP